MMSYWSSSLCTWRLACRASSQSGALRVISAICSLITGATATTKSVRTPITTTRTSRTDSPLLIPRRMKNSTTGLRPIARNVAITSRMRIEEIPSSCWVRNSATSAPRAPVNPMLNGECRRSDGARGAVRSAASS